MFLNLCPFDVVNIICLIKFIFLIENPIRKYVLIHFLFCVFFLNLQLSIYSLCRNNEFFCRNCFIFSHKHVIMKREFNLN